MKKQIKVACFPSDTSKEKVLGSNGKSLDMYCVKGVPDEDLITGNYIIDLTFRIDGNIQDLLQEEVILKVLLDYGYEIFRVSKVTVGTRYIDVVARQITIADSLTLWLEDVRPTNLNGQAAVSWLLDNAEGKKEIQIVSDIDTISTAYYQRMSLYKALHDNDNSFINRWGGEVQRRGYTIYINKRIGIDRGFSIREGKNLTGFEGTSNIDNLVTRARGQGYNGILGNYIDSPLIGSYNRIYTSIIKYDDVKVKDEYSDEGYDTLEEAQEELGRRISEEFSKNDIDKIKASYNINFVQLEKTEKYKNYIVAERLFIGDDCRVYIPKLSVDIKVRAMSRKYDILAQKPKEIKLSNYIEAKALSIKRVIEKLETMDSTETILQLAKDNASLLIKSGLKNSNVIVRENEIIIGDTKDINTMTNVWRWNAGGLGHSKTGYYGKFGTAITQDGAIVADFITTGVLNAALIKSGLLKSFNNKSWINLDDGTFNFAEKIKFDGSNFDIDLSQKDLSTNTSIQNLKSEFNLSVDELNMKVSSITASMGTNIVKNGRFQDSKNNWYESNGTALQGTVYTYNGVNWYKKSPNIYLKQNLGFLDKTLKYTFMCKAYGESKANFNLTVELYKGVNLLGRYGVTNVSGTQSEPFIMNYVFENIDSDEDVWLHISGITNTTINITQIEFFEPTVGNYATVESLTELSTTVNSIDMSVKKVETNLETTKTDVSTLQLRAGSIESTVSSNKTDADDKVSNLQSQITQQANLIQSKVSTNNFSTLIQQNAYAVKIAWNNISNYVQFENGGLSIYNGGVEVSRKRAVFDENGNHFWRDGYYLGKIGTNQYTGDTSIKGINFDLEYQGGYMTWAVKKTSSASTYTMMWTYANKTVGNYAAGKLHAGADIDMHNYYLRNVNFEGGGINGTLVFTQIVSMNTNGTASRWYNNSKLVFQNGILIDATWGSA